MMNEEKELFRFKCDVCKSDSVSDLSELDGYCDCDNCLPSICNLCDEVIRVVNNNNAIADDLRFEEWYNNGGYDRLVAESEVGERI